MINRQALLSDLQALLKRLEADLLERSEAAEVADVGESLRAEYERARSAERTALNFEDWRSDAITQAAAAWVLSCVFVRFLEDNRLIDPPKIAGVASDQRSAVSGQKEFAESRSLNADSFSRLQRARDEHELYFREHPTQTDREYLLSVFDELAALPGSKDVFGQHNAIRERPNWLSGDAAGELLRFFQKIDANSGDLIHDFTDPDWDTRFLGDLYQDLSEAARKKYALLQTPEFVEEFILDRTLEPALDEFWSEVISGQSAAVSGQSAAISDQRSAVRGQKGTAESRTLKADRFKLIDPACGSGHFLLGAFPRILDRWQRQEPGGNPRDLVQRTLDSIYGVDINPFAIAIARFRLLLAALRECRVTSLEDKLEFELNLACGDSLWHAPLVGERDASPLRGKAKPSKNQREFPEFRSDVDGQDGRHCYFSEDLDKVQKFLARSQYHCVVANPPYIVPKDRALNQEYRNRYKTCHRQYSLAVPFMEQINQLAVSGTHDSSRAGFTGQITANSFMKREFGKKLIESFLPQIDLTHVIDTSGAYIPGHGTPTVILLARNRKPVSETIRTVMGIRGEPSTPDDPSRGLVWSAIVDQIDQPDSQSEFVSVADSPRELFHKHPWSIGGGGAAELKEQLETDSASVLGKVVLEVGRTTHTGEDDAYFLAPNAIVTRDIRSVTVPLVTGEDVRDYDISPMLHSMFPYSKTSAKPLTSLPANMERHFWRYRAGLRRRMDFGQLIEERGLRWYEHAMFFPKRYRTPLSIVFAFVATHNHFVLDRGGKVFNRSAPVIKLPAEVATADGGTRPVTEDDHLALLGLLNSSTACFWARQTLHDKGNGGIGGGIASEEWERFFEWTGTHMQKFPLPEVRPLDLSRRLDRLALEMQNTSPVAVLSDQQSAVSSQQKSCALGSLVAARLSDARERYEQIRGQMIRLQEDLDWQCYHLYGLLDEELISSTHDGREGEAPAEPHSGSNVACATGSAGASPSRGCFPISLGQRAFEIVLARKLAAGEVQTTWFERHGSTPITDLPAAWPEDYRQLVQRRIDAIESNPNIALIEQPEYKRRWNTEPWDSQVERALRSWMLDRLESYFDFDARMLDSGQQSAVSGQSEKKADSRSLIAESSLTTVAKLADTARQDPQFMEVGEVYRDDPAFDVQRLVEELIQGEQVPLLPVLRYKPAGLRKRKEWEKTWELQRQEDELSDQLSAVSDQLEKASDDRERQQLAAQREQLTAESRQLTASIPVPPKYKSSDFISTGGARYWALRGKLDVPKERWVSFPHCEGPDGTLVIAWAGYDHLQLARAVSAYFVDIQERLGGRDDPRLFPLLACIIELLPWLKQWHHDLDPDYNQRMDEVFEGFVTEEAKNLGLTIEEIKAWEPVRRGAKGQRSRGAEGQRGKGAKKKRGRGAKGGES